MKETFKGSEEKHEGQRGGHRCFFEETGGLVLGWI